MSQKFEHIFKEALQNQEVPFDPNAWADLSARLDKTMPVSSKKGFGTNAALVLVIGVVSVASVWFFNTTEEDSTARTEQTSITDEEVELQTKEKDQKVEQVLPSTDKKQSNTKDTKKGLTTNTGRANQNNLDNSAFRKSKNDNELEFEKSLESNNLLSKPSNGFVSSFLQLAEERVDFNKELPTISNACQFTDTKVKNNSQLVITIDSPSGIQTKIQAGDSKTIEWNEAGVYKVYNSLTEKNFTIYTNKAIDFNVDNSNLYKNGLPTTEVYTNAEGNNMLWSSGKQTYSGSSATFHFYKKGNYTIQLNNTNGNGCTSASSKTVKIEEDYNLLASNAFNPRDLDARNNTFMPYALKERNTKFHLIILDPRDGKKVFETTDSASGWDGVDKQTGLPALSGTTYIWKVTLSNPMPGEPSDYRGTVIVVH